MHGGNIFGDGSRFFLAQGTRYVDLDGPLLLAKDRQPGLHFKGSQIFPPDEALWGGHCRTKQKKWP